MTDLPGGGPRDERVETNPDADLAEVLRDDALLDAIGSSRESAWADLPNDDVTRLLAAWQADAATYAAARIGPPVDAPAATASDVGTPAPPATRATRSRRHARPQQGRRIAPRSAAAISAAAVAGVVLSIGGVAAAVTGSPLTPLKAVVSGLAPAAGQDEGADIQTVTPGELASVRTAIKEGHLDEARRKLTDVREQAQTLDPPDRMDAFDEIADLEERLDKAEQATPQPSGPASDTPLPSATRTDSGTPSSTPSPTPSDTATPTPTGTAEPTASPSETSKGNGQSKSRSSPEHPNRHEMVDRMEVP